MCRSLRACFHNVVVSSCVCVCVCVCVIFVLFWTLRELFGGAWGRLGDPLGATWAFSGHLGGATGHCKRTDDKTWCAMNMGFFELLIFRLF